MSDIYCSDDEIRSNFRYYIYYRCAIKYDTLLNKKERMTINQICSNENNIIEIDQRRIDLFNDPNYGIILCFLDKYRSLLDLPNYPLQIFEDDLINYQEQSEFDLIDKKKQEFS